MASASDRVRGNILLVTGSRSINDQKLVWAALDALGALPAMLIHGGARGVDSLAEKWAKAKGVPTKSYPAANPRIKRSYIQRDHLMVDKADVVYAIWDGESRGTEATFTYADKKNKLIKPVFDARRVREAKEPEAAPPTSQVADDREDDEEDEHTPHFPDDRTPNSYSISQIDTWARVLAPVTLIIPSATCQVTESTTIRSNVPGGETLYCTGKWDTAGKRMLYVTSPSKKLYVESLGKGSSMVMKF